MTTPVDTSPIIVAQLRDERNDVTVTVTLARISVNWHPEPIPDSYTVTTSTGFRASFRACAHDRCLTGEIIPCSCSGQRSHGSYRKWRAHSQNRCHEWHTEKVVKFAETVLKIYSRESKRTPSVGVARGSYLPKEYVTCPEWPVEQRPNGVRFADGRERPRTYGIDIDHLINNLTEGKDQQ